MSRQAIQKDGNPIKVLQYLAAHDGTTSKELKLALKDIDCESMDRTLTTVKKKNFVSQKEKGAPYFLTPKGNSILRSFDIPGANDVRVFKKAPAANRFLPPSAPKPGAPKDGKITNGVTKFSCPDTMSPTMFSELVAEHRLAERCAEAIENLFQQWPR